MKKIIQAAFTTVAILLGLGLVLTACSEGQEQAEDAGDNIREESRAVTIALDRMLKAQPVPTFDWSQERQTVIDVQAIRAQGATTTSLFTLNGVGVLAWCPSIGAPVPATSQLTASQQYIDLKGDRTRERKPVDQMEPVGDYVGDTTATWTVCLDDNGKKFGVMWEANVGSVSGVLNVPAMFPDVVRWTPDNITFEFTEPGEVEEVADE